jgi:CO/xanthine dehydrogenase Mo-binding subunit
VVGSLIGTRVVRVEDPNLLVGKGTYIGNLRLPGLLQGDSNLDPRTAGHILGHSQIAFTARYSHVRAHRRSVAAGRIESTLYGRADRR